MGWQSLLLKGKKVAGKAMKKVKESDAPFAVAVGTVEVGRHIANKVLGKKDIHEGTITGIVKEIKKGIKKKGKK